MSDSNSSSGISVVNSLLCLTSNINPDLGLMSNSSKEEMIETVAAAAGSPDKGQNHDATSASKQNQVGTVMLFGVPIVSLVMDGKERLCLAQISSTLLKEFSYNEIHNRRVALGINCVQCTPVQLEILRRAGAMPVTSRRCGMITRREAERLCKSFLGDHAPPQLPENFAFDVYHECGWGCRGSFVPSRYNSSRAKCIRCSFCQLFFSPNKFIFHSHRLPESRYVQPDAANFNSWRRHMKLCGDPPEEANSSNSVSDMATAQIVHAWEDVKAMFNGGTRKRLLAATTSPSSSSHHSGGRHSSSNSHNTGASGSGSGGVGSGGKGSHKGNHSSNAENHRSSAMEGERVQSRSSGNNTSHSNHSNSKKESTSAGLVTGPGTNAQTTGGTPNIPPGGGYTNLQHEDSLPHPFLQHTPQNPFLQVPNPLLSPSSRLDSIWNPALPGPMAAAAAAAAVGQGVRPCPIPGSPSFSTLPFHPLSIPWLRRPLFPFSHPFSPSFLNEPASAAQEKLAGLTGASSRQNQSAFKPVSRNVEPLFNWLNGSAFCGNGSLPFGHPGTSTSLPEDLSVNSNTHVTTPGANSSNAGSNGGNPHLGGNHSHSSNHSTGDDCSRSGNNNVTSFSIAKQLEGTSNGNGGNKISSNNASKHHQIQILTSHNNESDDEENVDIESTVETEECSSTSSIWVSSTTTLLGKNGGPTSPTHTLGHTNNNNLNTLNNNNNNNNTIIGFNRRKRLATNTPSCYSSGDDEMMDDRDSDNQEDLSSISPNDTYDKYREHGIQEVEKGGKRKKLWVNELISTTDEDDDGTRQMLVNRGGRSESKH